MLSKQDIYIQRTFFILFWVLGCFGFVAEEIFPPLEKLTTVKNLLGDVVIIGLGLYTLRSRVDVFFISTYFVLSFISTCVVNDLGFVMWINGSRTMTCTIFLVPVLRYIWSDEHRHAAFIKSLDKQLVIWLVVQAVCVTEQFLRYGAGDHGGGSMGNLHSSSVSIGIYCFSFYLLHKRINPDAVLKSIKNNIWLVFLLYPTFLNETKISFILFVLYFLLLFPFNKEYLRRLLMMTPIALVVIGVGSWAYINTVEKSDDFLDMGFLLDTYLYSDLTIEEMGESTDYALDFYDEMPDVPRFAKIAAIPYIMEESGDHWIVGNGMGLYNGANQMAETTMMRDFNWFLIGTNPHLNFILVQLGILGLIWMLAYFAMLYVVPKDFKRNKNFFLLSLSVIVLLFFYGNNLTVPCFCFLFYVFCFLMFNKPHGLLKE